MVSRDSESFIEVFRAAKGTVKVPLDRRAILAKTERAVPWEDE
jgi:hypothetical protein